jgi:type II secretory pathway pseudopilin PulG
MHSGAIRVRMSPRLLGAISKAARRKEMSASAWLREAATILARLEGTLPTTTGRTAGKAGRGSSEKRRVQPPHERQIDPCNE